MPGKLLGDEIDEILRVAKEEGWCYNNFYLDWEKDERLPLNKIKEGKVRLFNIHNVAWLIVTRIYFSAFVSAFLWARTRIGSTLGLDMHGYEPTELIEWMSEVGDNWHDGDVKKWDGEFDPERWMMCVFITRMFYIHNRGISVEELQIYTVVAENGMWRIHVCGRTMYVALTGMPSGHGLTGPFNTVGHVCTSYMLYIELAYKHCPEHATCDSYDNNTREVKHGDDNLGNVSDTIKHWYHPSNIQGAYRSHGINYVPPAKQKEGDTVAFVPLSSVQYLKCNFRRDGRDPRFIHMAMSEDLTINELTNWHRSGQPLKEAVLQNLDQMQLFAYQHGRKFYEDKTALVNEQLVKYELPILTTTYEERDAEWLRKCGLPRDYVLIEE